MQFDIKEISKIEFSKVHSSLSHFNSNSNSNWKCYFNWIIFSIYFDTYIQYTNIHMLREIKERKTGGQTNNGRQNEEGKVAIIFWSTPNWTFPFVFSPKKLCRMHCRQPHLCSHISTFDTYIHLYIEIIWILFWMRILN